MAEGSAEAVAVTVDRERSRLWDGDGPNLWAKGNAWRAPAARSGSWVIRCWLAVIGRAWSHGR